MQIKVNQVMNTISKYELYEYINTKGIYADGVEDFMNGAAFDITLLAGDWKHDHGYLRYLMEQIGYYQTREDVIDDSYNDGGDCYSAKHRFVFKPFFELFNGKID